MSEWMDISTAPKDGTYIIVWPPTWPGVTSCAKWDKDEFEINPKPYWRRIDAGGRTSIDRGKPPTHWMHRPKPPEESK